MPKGDFWRVNREGNFYRNVCDESLYTKYPIRTKYTRLYVCTTLEAFSIQPICLATTLITVVVFLIFCSHNLQITLISIVCYRNLIENDMA